MCEREVAEQCSFFGGTRNPAQRPRNDSRRKLASAKAGFEATGFNLIFLFNFPHITNTQAPRRQQRHAATAFAKSFEVCPVLI
jgi:hypothetical protein